MEKSIEVPLRDFPKHNSLEQPELTREQVLDKIQKENSCSREEAERILYEEERWEATFE